MIVDENIKALILEVIYELIKLTVQEIQEFKAEWDAELERTNTHEWVRNYCKALCDAVIEEKQKMA